MPDPGPARAALTLHQAAALVGAYRWAEEHLFACTGRWSADARMTPAGQVALFEASRRHGWLAGLWAERLPAVAGVDPEALTRPSGDLAGVVDRLVVTEAPAERLVALHGHVLPRLAATYRRHLDRTVPVADRPVARVLRLALDAVAEDEAALTPVVEHVLLAGGMDPASGPQASGPDPSRPATPLVPWPT